MALSITGFIHCNVNCTDVGRSRQFYEGLLGLTPTTHTNPEPQDGTGFAMGPSIQWDAWILRPPGAGARAVSLDLLEWKLPTPAGKPYPVANHLGMFRLCYLVPDVDALYRTLVGAGVEVYSEPVSVDLRTRPEGHEVRLFCAKDPDGTTVEFVQSDVDSIRPVHVNVNCSNLERSTEWYRDVLGVEVRGHSRSGMAPGEAFGFDRDCDWDANFLFFPDEARGGFGIDLVEWKAPKPVGTPYAGANHLGIFRMALGTPDIQAAYQELLDIGVKCFSPPVWLDLGPEVASGGCWALFFPDPDGTCVELIETR